MTALHKVLEDIGSAQVKFQMLDQCLTGATTKGKGKNQHTEVRIATTAVTPGDFLGRPSETLGIIVWVNREDWKESVRRLTEAENTPTPKDA